MPLRIPSSRNLSDLLINIDKDWAGKNITNLGAGAFDLNAKLNAIVNAADIQFKTGALHTGAEHAEGGALELIDALDIDALAKLVRALYESGYVWWFNSHWLPPGLMGENLAGSGLLDPSTSNIRLETEDTINSYAGVYKSMIGGYGWPSITWSKARRFRALVRFYSYGRDSPAHVVTGDITNIDANIERHVGFKMKTDQYLYATVGNGSAETELQIGDHRTASFYADLEAVFTPGVEARFYLNGADVGTIETNLPTGATDATYLFNALVANEVASNKRLYLYHVRMMQEPY